MKPMKRLRLLGIVPNKFTRQTKIPEKRLKELKELYPEAPILTTIPKTVTIEKAQAEGKSILEYDPNGKLVGHLKNSQGR